MTLWSAIKYLKTTMVAINSIEKIMWIFFLIFSCSSLVVFLSISKISILKEVVKEVKAESALEYAAAIKPNKKNSAVVVPKFPCVARIGKSSS